MKISIPCLFTMLMTSVLVLGDNSMTGQSSIGLDAVKENENKENQEDTIFRKDKIGFDGNKASRMSMAKLNDAHDTTRLRRTGNVFTRFYGELVSAFEDKFDSEAAEYNWNVMWDFSSFESEYEADECQRCPSPLEENWCCRHKRPSKCAKYTWKHQRSGKIEYYCSCGGERQNCIECWDRTGDRARGRNVHRPCGPLPEDDWCSHQDASSRCRCRNIPGMACRLKSGAGRPGYNPGCGAGKLAYWCRLPQDDLCEDTSLTRCRCRNISTMTCGQDAGSGRPGHNSGCGVGKPSWHCDAK